MKRRTLLKIKNYCCLPFKQSKFLQILLIFFFFRVQTGFWSIDTSIPTLSPNLRISFVNTKLIDNWLPHNQKPQIRLPDWSLTLHVLQLPKILMTISLTLLSWCPLVWVIKDQLLWVLYMTVTNVDISYNICIHTL